MDERLTDLVAILDELTDSQLEDVRLYALSRAVGPAALGDLAGPERDIYHSRHVSKLLDWGLVDPFSWRRTAQGAALVRKFA